MELEFIIQATAAEVVLGPHGRSVVEVSGVGIDSRTIKSGQLFAAVRGERFDGHEFVDRAVALGCVAVLVERATSEPLGIPQLLVPDVPAALARLATAWRLWVNPRVIAVTGSSGKTTVKEMLAAILRREFRLHATGGNLNNHLGLPLTILGMAPDTEVLVVELGMSAAGEIAFLAGISQPEIGIVTTVLPAHLEYFASVAEIARAKGELVAALPPSGWALIPGDHEFTPLLRGLARGRVISLGLEAGCDLAATGVVSEESGCGFTINIRSEASIGLRGLAPELLELAGRRLRLGCHGEHQLRNALMAGVAARLAGASLAAVEESLAGFAPMAGRGGLRISERGWRVVDDTYNANPGSVRAALAALGGGERGGGRRVAILGDMLELGVEAPRLHRELAPAIRAAGVELVLTAGPLMEQLHRELAGDEGRVSLHRADPGQWEGGVAALLRPGDVVLVKGSRGMKMERIVKEIA